MATHSSILAWRIPMDRGAWWPIVHGVANSWTRLKLLGTHTYTNPWLCITQMYQWLIKPPSTEYLLIATVYDSKDIFETLEGGASGKESACQCRRQNRHNSIQTHSSPLAWKIPSTEEHGGLQSVGVTRVGHDCVIDHTHTVNWEELENIWSRLYKLIGDNIFFQPVIVKVECSIQFLILRLCPSHFLCIKKSFPYEVVMLVHVRFSCLFVWRSPHLGKQKVCSPMHSKSLLNTLRVTKSKVWESGNGSSTALSLLMETMFSDLVQRCENTCTKHPAWVEASSVSQKLLWWLAEIPSKSQKLQPSLGFFPVVSSVFLLPGFSSCFY